MIDELIYKKFWEKITTAKNILLISDRNSDGDSLGSITAFSQFLKQIKKQHTAFVANEIPLTLKFIPIVEEITIGQENINITNYDLVITFDFSDFQQSGIGFDLKNLSEQKKIFIINFDHHVTNKMFGQLNFVDNKASSTTEIVFYALKKINAQIDKNIATSLLTGILTDTNNFANAATTFSSMKASSELMLLGARIQEITFHTWKNKPVSILKLWGKILLRLEEKPESGIAVTAITLKDLEEASLSSEAISGVANFLNSLSRTKAVLVLKEEADGIIKGSLRTTNDDIDVSKIAQLFGGGGHKKAAGFTVKGRLREGVNGWEII